MLYTIDTDRILADAAKNVAKTVAKNAAATSADAAVTAGVLAAPADRKSVV